MVRGRQIEKVKVSICLPFQQVAPVRLSRFLNMAMTNASPTAASAAAGGLALVIAMFRNRESLNVDRSNLLKW